jgi:hypothetical protein
MIWIIIRRRIFGEMSLFAPVRYQLRCPRHNMAKGFSNSAQMVGVGRNVPMDKGPSLPTCRTCCLDFRVIRITYDTHGFVPNVSRRCVGLSRFEHIGARCGPNIGVLVLKFPLQGVKAPARKRLRAVLVSVAARSVSQSGGVSAHLCSQTPGRALILVKVRI